MIDDKIESAFSEVMSMLTTHTGNINKQIQAVARNSSDEYRRQIEQLEERKPSDPIRFDLKSGFGYDELMHQSELQKNENTDGGMEVTDSERIAFRSRLNHVSINVAECIVCDLEGELWDRTGKKTANL